jgi:hypothetical protein
MAPEASRAIGDVFADAMRTETTADIAIRNAGSIRGNRIYPAAQLARRTVKGGDGYTMFADARALIDPESGSLLVSALEKYIASHGTIAAQVDGRIAIVR